MKDSNEFDLIWSEMDRKLFYLKSKMIEKRAITHWIFSLQIYNKYSVDDKKLEYITNYYLVNHIVIYLFLQIKQQKLTHLTRFIYSPTKIKRKKNSHRVDCFITKHVSTIGFFPFLKNYYNFHKNDNPNKLKMVKGLDPR